MKTKKQFLKEVVAELDTIREKATKEELKRLDFNKFRFYKPENCIYGQLTGNCHSIRAAVIMPKSYSGITSINGNIEKINPIDFSQLDTGRGRLFTALEQYLYIVDSDKHREILQYLKGEIKTIEIK